MTSALLALALAASPTYRVGVTLHPYYAWTAAVAAGTPVEVVPVLPGEVDAGAYQPTAGDVARLRDLDALVVNGLGHDAFIEAMVAASGNRRLRWIRPNDGAALLPWRRGGGDNSHTFLSLTNAAQQAHAIARALAEALPEHAAAFRKNASAYAAGLRALRQETLRRLRGAKERRVVTVHDGYAYLLQELGLELAGVVQPAHGLVPSAAELGQVVTLLKREQVRVVLSEEAFPPALARVLEEAGAKVVVVSHVATGAYTREKFEVDMRANLDALVVALGGAP